MGYAHGSQGLSESTFNQPVHLVTYYRYLRFFHDGTCLVRLAADEPALVVRALRPGAKAASTMLGRWEQRGEHLAVRAADANRQCVTFCMQLRIRSTTRGRHNKLVWKDYYSIDADRDDDVTNYALTHFKNYFFSRVNAFIV